MISSFPFKFGALILMLGSASAANAQSVKLALLDQGRKDDRREIRFDPTPGLHAWVRTNRDRYMDIELKDPTVTFEKGMQKQRINDPVVVTLDHLQVLDRKPDAPPKVSRGLESFEVHDSIGLRGFSMPGAVDEPTEPAIRTILSQLSGKFLGYTLNSQGWVTAEDHHFVYMDYVAQGLAGEPFFLAVQPVFPEDPVGIGAQWTAERNVTLEGTLVLPIRVTFTLDAIQDEALSLSYQVVDAGPTRDFQFPIPVEGGTAKVGKSTLSGGGRLVFKPSVPAPMEMTMDTEFLFSILIEREGVQASYIMDIRMNYESAVEKTEIVATPVPAPANP